MGTVAAIFWIFLGALYILYQAFKEEPAYTTVGVVTCVAIIGAVIVEFLIIKYGTWYAALVIPVCGFATFAIHEHKESVKQRIYLEAVDRVSEIELMEEDLERLGYEACKNYPDRYSDDPSSPNYWRNDRKLQGSIFDWQKREIDKYVRRYS